MDASRPDHIKYQMNRFSRYCDHLARRLDGSCRPENEIALLPRTDSLFSGRTETAAEVKRKGTKRLSPGVSLVLPTVQSRNEV